ncbi:hypothetical protein PRUPE_1G573500 [Prunus persica]|uniref:Uncharacterized protein n=1 Tax=Prunus persica TaxID=3760 RepID=A0A251RJJ1_PRUPE|nr:hypothetical protein PRUPE_1G573500 [Prunus persica]
MQGTDGIKIHKSLHNREAKVHFRNNGAPICKRSKKKIIK